MAKLETTVWGDFDRIVAQVEQEITMGSVSASLEDSSDFTTQNARCAVRVFERYSAIGSNRVSLSVTFFQGQIGGAIQVSAIASGGSQAIFFKINTLGEGSFLSELKDILANLKG